MFEETIKAFKRDCFDMKWSVKKNPLFIVILFCLIGCACDVISSIGGLETNEFARHPDGTFWISHGITIKIFYLLIYSFFSLAVYSVVEEYNKKLANIAVAIPFVYLGYTSMEAALSNFLILFGWYVPMQGPNFHIVIK